MLTVSSLTNTEVVTSVAITVSSARTWSTETPPPTTALAAIKPRNTFVAETCCGVGDSFTLVFSEVVCLPNWISPICDITVRTQCFPDLCIFTRLLRETSV